MNEATPDFPSQTAAAFNQVHDLADGDASASELHSIGYYRQILTSGLNPEIFKPVPTRLVWFGVCALASSLSFFLIVAGSIGWPLKLLCAIVLGLSNGTFGFVCHELLHGSIIKNQRMQTLLAFFGSAPFLISPTYWRYSHNRMHHGKTQQLISDPDAFPNLRIFKSSRFMNFMFPFTPGSRRKRSYLYFFFWFSFHNLASQTYLRFRNRTFDSLDHRRATLEFIGQAALVSGLLIYAGPANWLWVLVIPLALQNYLLMSYISTNHNLSPLTKKNDPLVNSLTVTNHPILEFLHLNFGYHVEHHIFPMMSGRHIKAAHRELIKKFPNEYQVMPKWKAMRALYSTARIYKNANQLVHPASGATFATIGGAVPGGDHQRV